MPNNDTFLIILFILTIVLSIGLTFFITKSIVLNASKTKLVLPLKLQAYERLILFLERTSPANLLVRENGDGLDALSYQQLLLQTIRQEYNHNLAQQIYLSQPTWAVISNAMNQTLVLINQSATGLDSTNSARDLSKKILENAVLNNQNPTQLALDLLREEIGENVL
jgi:hypothetical protein